MMTFTESETLELKTSTGELSEAVVAIVAILNKHQKGELYFGIKNNGEVVGQDVSDKTLRDISQSISDHIEPKIFPQVERITIDDESCVQVLFEGKETPYFADGRAYIRVGTENKQVSPSELKKIIRQNNGVYWDDQYSENELKEINAKTLKQFMSKAKKAGRINFKFTNVEETLKKLHLYKGDKLLNAAEVLFCNQNNLELQAAVFAGKDKVTFLDIQLFKGNIFDLLAKGESYLKEHMNWRADLSGSKRKEIPEVSLRALSEALVNSFCHRDYFRREGNKIAVFKDRIEIYNPGAFPKNKSPEDFIKKEEESILRNPTIAHNLYLSEDIEKWGSGLKRIYEECVNSGVKVEFLELSDGFKVVFYRKEQTPQVTPQVTPQAELTELEQTILNLVKNNPRASRNELAATLKISEDTVKEYLTKLKKKKVIRRVGKTSAGYWEILYHNKE